MLLLLLALAAAGASVGVLLAWLGDAAWSRWSR